MRVFVVLILVFFIQGCASTQGVVGLKVGASSKILIVSKLQESFFFQKTGTTSFQNRKLTADVGSWDLNAQIEERCVNSLSSNYIPSADKEISSQLTVPSDNYLTGYSNPMTEKNGLDVLRAKNFDYVLFITPMKFQDAYFATNQFVEGYGIYIRSFMGSEKAILYSQIRFTMFDVASGKFLASNGDTGSN